MSKILKEKLNENGLFDHVKHIQTIQNKDYYENLCEKEKKSFNKYVILNALSMNPTLIEHIHAIFKYYDFLTNEMLYRLLIEIVPIDHSHYKYITNNKKIKCNEIIDIIAEHYMVSYRDATEYFQTFQLDDRYLNELVSLLEGKGLSEKEIYKMFD